MFTSHVKTTPSRIFHNSKFYPFFQNTLGAIYGTHINCCPPAADPKASHDHKGCLTQNCLAICNFNMAFHYVFSGWDAQITDLPVLRGKYYLADMSFPTCDALLILY